MWVITRNYADSTKRLLATVSGIGDYPGRGPRFTGGRRASLSGQLLGGGDPGGLQGGSDAEEEVYDLDIQAPGDAFEHPGRGVFLAAFDLGEV